MKDNNFLQLHISYFGFEKKIREQLELSLFENIGLLKNSYYCNINSGETDLLNINIHIYFFKDLFDMNMQTLERSRSINARVLCIAPFNDFENLLSCVQAGCFGCISILNMYEEIIPAIQSVLQNKIYISPAFAPVVNKYFKEHKNHYADIFTKRENKLIQLLTNGALYKEIAWKLRISENTVRSHVRNIYSKMKVHSKTELTQKILSHHLVSSFAYFFSEYVACLCY
jgi:DNA-binding NarL/FixJ family response regulator